MLAECVSQESLTGESASAHLLFFNSLNHDGKSHFLRVRQTSRLTTCSIEFFQSIHVKRVSLLCIGLQTLTLNQRRCGRWRTKKKLMGCESSESRLSGTFLGERTFASFIRRRKT